MCCAVAGAALFLGSSPAHSTFIVATNPSGDQFFNGDANKNVSSFTGTVGGQHSGREVTVTTVGNVDTGDGFSNIKPIKDGSLTSLTFTPADPNLFADFSFRGQLEANAGGHVLLTVQDNQGNAPQVFSFSNLGANADFDRIGIVAAPGSGETIKSITLNSLFREQKQNEFSLAGAVPEPETYAMLGLGLALLGIALRRRDAI
jgi:PEP-CTERM motif-containing protein